MLGIAAITLSLTSCNNMYSWKIINKEHQPARKVPEIMFLPVEPFLFVETGDSTLIGEKYNLILGREQVMLARGIPFNQRVTRRIEVTPDAYNSSHIGDSYISR